MGLREKKAAQSRQRMVDVALDLFLRDGYDETTMERIAEEAEVGTTTLYRYFPTKDQLLLDRLMQDVEFAPHLRARPEDEPLEIAIGEALLSVGRVLDDPGRRITDVRRLIDSTAGARAKLWESYRASREALEVAIAERMGPEPPELAVRVSAGMMLELLQIADETHKQSGYDRSHADILEELLHLLPETAVILPIHPAMIAAGGERTQTHYHGA